MGLFTFLGNVIKGAEKVAVGTISALATKGAGGNLGIFNNQTAVPVTSKTPGTHSTVAVPQNTSGVGIFNTANNSTPLGLVKTAIGNQAVQWVAGKLTPASGQALDVVKKIGLPVPSSAAQTQQVKGLAASGALDDYAEQEQVKDNSILWVLAAIVGGKYFKLW